MSKVVVVYHSGYGHTKKQAEALAQGAQATLIAIDAEGNISEQEWQLLDEAKAIVFGSPTYMGNVSWQFKKFADATSKIWFTQKWKNKFFGGFTNSATMNGDKHSTLHYFITLAMQHSGIWVGTGLMASNAKSAHRDDVNFVGSFAGAMMQTPSDASSDEVNQGDLKTAELYGQRILECVKG
ncbi:MAG: NADPH-dependent FMN reductase [Ferrovum sp. 37-45-19]|nr:MAG: NADPH-dependent FMN reductase [Ferrovum sp. 21-44-67]OYV94243.1 MAG: NADPH-dependent FMN reductase [Ferrovum sp. 37-45-19]OZB31725.1 MAG: NADPH-dependent FMN reductase [Ferrovum sp. 34-44-207]HQT81717.1 flavodoxin family protein [Ferrovaceae bacterium]HQU07019.1 flavodoxin family protein [Ferrovaceae bacterium]